MRIVSTLIVVFGILIPQEAIGGEAEAGGIQFSLGFESYPGKLFYRLDGIRYISGSARDFRYNPVSDDATFVVLSLRVKKKVPVGVRDLSVGLESGVSLPVSGYQKSWDLPALTSEVTGDIYFPSFCWGGGLNANYSQFGKEENELTVIPVLASLGYTRALRSDLTLGLGLGMGGYIVHSADVTTEIYRYETNHESWKKGDVRKNVYRAHMTALTPGVEGSVALTYPINSSICLGLTGKIIVISRIRDTWDYTEYCPTDWDPAPPQLVTIKNGYEYGGVGWGMSATVSF
jgi:hypothetical protein